MTFPGVFELDMTTGGRVKEGVPVSSMMQICEELESSGLPLTVKAHTTGYGLVNDAQIDRQTALVLHLSKFPWLSIHDGVLIC